MHGLTLLQPEGNLMDEFLLARWIINGQRDYTARRLVLVFYLFFRSRYNLLSFSQPHLDDVD